MSLSNREQLIQNLLESFGVFARLGAGRAGKRALPRNMPTHAQIGVLAVLARDGSLGVRDLAARFGTSSSATTQLINAMVTEGLVARADDAKDRRHVRLTLTAVGKKKLMTARGARLKAMTKMFEPLSDGELAQFLKLQKKMSDHFQQTYLKK